MTLNATDKHRRKVFLWEDTWEHEFGGRLTVIRTLRIKQTAKVQEILITIRTGN